MPSQQPARHREVARRYRRRTRQPDLRAIRLAELSRLLRARHGDVLPDTVDSRRLIRIVAHHLAELPGDPRRRITSWLELRAPWISLQDMRALILEVVDRPRRWRAQSLAWVVRLLHVDRKALRITTIGAVDLSEADRREHRQAEARARAEASRRRKGAKPRADYLAEVRRQEAPWAALGMSRRTWYRRGKPSPDGTAGTRGTGSVRSI